MLTGPCKVFISYSHEDDALCRELVKHLALLRRQGKIDAWHDRRIAAGDEWRGQIDDKLEAGAVAGDPMAPVRHFEPNRWGLYEVHGNVWEWVWDWPV